MNRENIHKKIKCKSGKVLTQKEILLKIERKEIVTEIDVKNHLLKGF
jgi:hypothetical protein